MKDSAVEALSEQFTRAWDMVLEAARRFPEDEWCEAAEERMQPARLVYHLLVAAQRYTWLGAADDYLPNRRFALDWVKTPAHDLPERERAVEHVEQAKNETLAWIRHFGEGRLLTEKPLWPWTGDSALAQGIYHLRHLQHHVAELNAELRRRGLKPAEWK